MSMATASIFAPLGRSRFQNGFSASAPLPSPTKTTAAALQVQDHRQVAVPLGDGDLVDGDVPQVLELGLGEPPRQVALLDVLDQVPADAQVHGHVADGHAPAQLQGVPLEGAWCSSAAGRRRGPRPGGRRRRPGIRRAGWAGPRRWPGRRWAGTGSGARPGRGEWTSGRAAGRAAAGLGLLADGEDRLAALVVGAGVLVADFGASSNGPVELNRFAVESRSVGLLPVEGLPFLRAPPDLVPRHLLRPRSSDPRCRSRAPAEP